MEWKIQDQQQWQQQQVESLNQQMVAYASIRDQLNQMHNFFIEQVERLKQQQMVAYTSICKQLAQMQKFFNGQLLQMQKSFNFQQDFADRRSSNLYCDPMKATSGHRMTARQRWTPTPRQFEILDGIFNEGNNTPSKKNIQEITTILAQYGHITESNVYNWFQNRRARVRRKRLAPATSNADAKDEKTQPERV